MHIDVVGLGVSDLVAPATLLGQNLEMTLDTSAGLLAERLANPKFRGPAHPLTGIAQGWQPAQGNNLAGIRFDLTHGMSLSGEESQLIHNYCGRQGIGILQTGRWVRQGERLEVSLWARAQHHPVRLRVGLRPLQARATYYDEAVIDVATTYWKSYRASLAAPCDDQEAVFFCYLDGEGMTWLDQVHLRPAESGLVRQDVMDLVRSLRIPVLRFPGGCVSTNYHWRYGTGSAQLRPSLADPVFKWSMEYDFGTDEYLALCQGMGIRPQITINIGSGTPDEAGEWAAYCAEWYRQRGIEPPAMYWQMGNEHYGAWELGNMSGDLYAEALHEYVPAVRRNYPRARIIALGPETGDILPEQRLPWRMPVLEKAGDLVDVVAMQAYASGWDADKTRQYAGVLQQAERVAAMLQRAIDDCTRAGKGTRVALTEWNLWHNAAHYDDKGFLEPYDVEHGLYVASMLHHFVRLAPGLELANFYHLINPMGVFISRGPQLQETVLADVFRLYRPAFPGNVVALAVQSPLLLEGVPIVDATCLADAQGMWLFVANRSQSEEAELDLKALPVVTDGTMLVGTDTQGIFTSAAMQAGQPVTIPPLSVARLRLGAG